MTEPCYYHLVGYDSGRCVVCGEERPDVRINWADPFEAGPLFAGLDRLMRGELEPPFVFITWGEGPLSLNRGRRVDNTAVKNSPAAFLPPHK